MQSKERLYQELLRQKAPAIIRENFEFTAIAILYTATGWKPPNSLVVF
jgi:hypothetical protein